LQLSSPVNPSTVTPQTFSVVDSTTNAVLSGSLQTDPFGFTASFVPAQPYGVGRLIQVTVSGVKDVFGNSFPLTSFSFTTGFNADNQGFHLVGTSPTNGLNAVPLNALVVLEFDEPIDAISALVGLQVQLAGAPIAGAVALSDGNKRITFTPAAPLAANSTYLVVTTPRLTDFSGNQLLNPDSSTFVTGNAADNSAGPTATLVSPTTPAPTNSIIQLRFNKRLNPLTVTNATFPVFALDTNSSVAGSVAVSADLLTVTFTSSSPWQPGTTYAIGNPGSIGLPVGITDLVGQAAFLCNAHGCDPFTTDVGPTSTAPTVVSVSPQNGAVGVQANARIVVVASSPISAPSVGSNAVTLSAGGTAVSGSIALGSDGQTLSFAPSSLLVPSTTYTVNVSGFTDQAGNAVVPFTSTFTTGTSGAADTTTPAAVSVSPANGAGNVPVNSSVVVTFNKNIDPTSVNNNTVQIFVPGPGGFFNGALAGSYVVNGATVTFTPLTALPGGATVQVQVYNYRVRDYAGNSAPCCSIFGSSFITAAVRDTTPPQVISVTPNNGAIGIGQDTMVVLTFSKSLDPTTTNNNTIGLLVNGTLASVQMSTSLDNRVVTLRGTLPPNSTIAVVATSVVKDLSGNSLGNFESLFTTAPAFDTKNPYVIGQRPANGASGVATNAKVVLYVSEPMNQSTVPGAFHVSQNGVLVSGQVQLTDSGQTIQFTPSVPFQNSALIQVFLDSTAFDADGNSLTSYQASFRTVQDLTTVAPSIVNTNPLNTGGIPTNVVIGLGFNEALNPTTVNTTTVSLMQVSTVVPATVSLVGGGTMVQITPNAPLAANTSYSVQLTTGLLGANGMPDSAAPGSVLSFTTGSGTDTVNPTALISPPNSAVNVGNNANIRVRFSKAINPLTVNGNTISISGGSFTQVPYSTFFTSNQAVLITPNAPLPDATQMTLTVSGVTDIAGNAVVAQTANFTTGTGPDTVIPLVIKENPFSRDANVPVNTPIQLLMNEPIDPGTVNTNSVLVQNNSTSQAVAGSYSVSADGQTISFVPSAPLAVSTNYTVFFESRGITDLAGNALPDQQNGGLPNQGVSPFVFTTGTAPNTTAPQVVGVSPGGLTGVPINSQVLVQFNEPVDGLTVNQVTLSNGGGTVNVSRTLSNGNQTLILTAVAPLAPNTVYNVTVTGVQDISGNSMTAPVTVTASFTTGAGADLTPPPNVVSVSPAHGATGVPTTTTIQLQFSKRLDPLTVTNSTLGVFVLSSQASVAGSILVSADGLTVTFTPTSALSPQTSYRIAPTSGITDLIGQGFPVLCSSIGCYSFTTGTQ
jgi:hypothetical protein